MKRIVKENTRFSKGDVLVCPRCFNEVPTEGLGKRWFYPQKHECSCGISYVIVKGEVTYIEE